MWQILRIFKTAHCKVADFRRGRARQIDEEFIAECGLPSDVESSRIGIGVRRAVAGLGLIDPLFIRASDRFPEELGMLPLWDSMDWLSFTFQLEEELGQKTPRPIEGWDVQHKFTVKQLVQAVHQHLTCQSGD